MTNCFTNIFFSFRCRVTHPCSRLKGILESEVSCWTIRSKCFQSFSQRKESSKTWKFFKTICLIGNSTNGKKFSSKNLVCLYSYVFVSFQIIYLFLTYIMKCELWFLMTNIQPSRNLRLKLQQTDQGFLKETHLQKQ